MKATQSLSKAKILIGIKNALCTAGPIDFVFKTMVGHIRVYLREVTPLIITDEYTARAEVLRRMNLFITGEDEIGITTQTRSGTARWAPNSVSINDVELPGEFEDALASFIRANLSMEQVVLFSRVKEWLDGGGAWWEFRDNNRPERITVSKEWLAARHAAAALIVRNNVIDEASRETAKKSIEVLYWMADMSFVFTRKHGTYITHLDNEKLHIYSARSLVLADVHLPNAIVNHYNELYPGINSTAMEHRAVANRQFAFMSHLVAIKELIEYDTSIKYDTVASGGDIYISIGREYLDRCIAAIVHDVDAGTSDTLQRLDALLESISGTVYILRDGKLVVNKTYGGNQYTLVPDYDCADYIYAVPSAVLEMLPSIKSVAVTTDVVAIGTEHTHGGYRYHPRISGTHKEDLIMNTINELTGLPNASKVPSRPRSDIEVKQLTMLSGLCKLLNSDSSFVYRIASEGTDLVVSLDTEYVEQCIDFAYEHCFFPTPTIPPEVKEIRAIGGRLALIKDLKFILSSTGRITIEINNGVGHDSIAINNYDEAQHAVPAYVSWLCKGHMARMSGGGAEANWKASTKHMGTGRYAKYVLTTIGELVVKITESSGIAPTAGPEQVKVSVGKVTGSVLGAIEIIVNTPWLLQLTSSIDNGVNIQRHDEVCSALEGTYSETAANASYQVHLEYVRRMIKIASGVTTIIDGWETKFTYRDTDVTIPLNEEETACVLHGANKVPPNSIEYHGILTRVIGNLNAGKEKWNIIDGSKPHNWVQLCNTYPIDSILYVLGGSGWLCIYYIAESFLYTISESDLAAVGGEIPAEMKRLYK